MHVLWQRCAEVVDGQHSWNSNVAVARFLLAYLWSPKLIHRAFVCLPRSNLADWRDTPDHTLGLATESNQRCIAVISQLVVCTLLCTNMHPRILWKPPLMEGLPRLDETSGTEHAFALAIPILNGRQQL